ncbi:MAG: M23 family metallopeptidase [Bacillota bacterium]
MTSGIVTKILRNHKSYGKCIHIKHYDGYLSLYAHLDKIYVELNQQVDSDTPIGTEGTSGNTTGTHLHLEIHKGEYKHPATIDPEAFIQK